VATKTIKYAPQSAVPARKSVYKLHAFPKNLWFPLVFEALNGILALLIGVNLVTNNGYYWEAFLEFAPELARQWRNKILPTVATSIPFLGFIAVGVLNFTSIYGLLFGRSLVIRYTEILNKLRIIISAVLTVLISIIYFAASGKLENIPPILSLGGFILPQIIASTALPWVNWITIILGIIFIVALIYTIKEGFKITLSDIFFLLLLILLVLIFGTIILAFLLIALFAIFIASLIGALATVAFPVAFFLSFLTALVPLMYVVELFTLGMIPYQLFLPAGLFTLLGNIMEYIKLKKV
jgi:hypothetical protein